VCQTARLTLEGLSIKSNLFANTKYERKKTDEKPEINQSEKNNYKLECGPMPNLMVALPNIGGALCSTPQSLADAHY